mmetsp:Transcript_1070/g.6827  ORF Transcript_1070/g.6827 Transcript_1070/m.6827 type:complete len:432 (-) Transcript_1070:653-1948(-)
MSDALASQLHTFARTNDVRGIRQVLESGGDPSCTASASQNTALHISSANGSMQATRVLLDEGGIDPEVPNCNGDTPLMFSVMKRNLGIASLLLHRGASVARQNASGLTAMSCAASNGDEAALDLLLRHAAKEEEKGKLKVSDWIDLQDAHGRNLLHFACEGGSVGCVRLLLKVGSSATHRNKAGETPYSIARKGRMNEIIRLLEERSSCNTVGLDIDEASSTNGAPDVVTHVRKPVSRQEKKSARKSVKSPVEKQNFVASKDETLRILRQKLLATKLQKRGCPADSEAQSSTQEEWLKVTKQGPQKETHDRPPVTEPNSLPNRGLHRTFGEDPSIADQVCREACDAHWLEVAEALMEVEFPEAAALDIRPCHVLGLDTSDLSLSQVDALQHIHQSAVKHLEDVKIELVRKQERMRYEEEVEFKTMLRRYKE